MKLSIVVAATFGVGLGASLFLNYYQHQQADQDKRLLKGQITDLTYQVVQDRANANSPSPNPSGTPATSPSATAPPSPSASPVLGAQAPAPATATTKQRVHLRAAASATSQDLGWVEANTAVTLGSFANANWQEVTVTTRHGYIAKTYLRY